MSYQVVLLSVIAASQRGIMTTLANPSSSKRRLLLASDRSDQSSELASILQSVGQVDTISASDILDAPAGAQEEP